MIQIAILLSLLSMQAASSATVCRPLPVEMVNRKIEVAFKNLALRSKRAVGTVKLSGHQFDKHLWLVRVENSADSSRVYGAMANCDLSRIEFSVLSKPGK